MINGFLSSVENYPDNPALWVGNGFLSYAELFEKSYMIAKNLLTSDLEDSKQCAVFCGRNENAYMAVLGVQIAGMAYVPLGNELPDERNIEIIKEAGVKSVIADKGCLSKARHILSECDALTVFVPDSAELPGWTAGLEKHTFVTKDKLEACDKDVPNVDIKPETLACMLFSWQDDILKVVTVTQKGGEDYVKKISRRYAPTPYDRFSQYFDLIKPASIHDMFVCWTAGACLCVVPENKKDFPDEFIKEHELTFWFSNPLAASNIRRIERLKPDSFPSLSFSLFCGGEMPTELAAEWKAAAPNSVLENLYGPTDVSIISTVYQYDEEKDARLALPVVPLGVPLSGQEIVLLDVSGQPVNPGEIGELYIGGDFLTPGCWESRYMEKDRFVHQKFPGKDSEHWYCTDELACWNDEVGLIYNGKVRRRF